MFVFNYGTSSNFFLTNLELVPQKEEFFELLLCCLLIELCEDSEPWI